MDILIIITFLSLVIWLAIKQWRFLLIAGAAIFVWNIFWHVVTKIDSSKYTIIVSGNIYTCQNDQFGRECYNKNGIGLADEEYWKREARINAANKH